MNIKVTKPLLILAAGVILVAGGAFGAIGATKAEGEYSSKAEGVSFETAEFTVDLMENQNGKYQSVAGSAEAPKTLEITSLSNVTAGKEEIQVEHPYEEEVKVVNNSKGDFPQYVRVVVSKYWTDLDGNKDTEADPEFINLETTGDWAAVPSESNTEETVYYYKKPLEKNAEAQLLKSISFDKDVLDAYKITKTDEDGNKVVTIKGYQKKKCNIEVRVDAIQARSAKDAILGAWGIDVTFDDAGNITSIDGTDIKGGE